MKLVLLLKNVPVRLYNPGDRVRLANDTDFTSPAYAGWSRADGYRLAAVGPNEPPAGKRFVSQSISGIVMDGPNPTWAVEDVPLPTMEELAAYAAAARYEQEVGGFSWNGWPVATDDRSQGKIGNEVLATQTGARQDGEMWKFADGTFRPLTNAEVVQMGTAAREHVKACFAIEGGLLMGIMGGTIISYGQIDATEWPS